MLIIGNGGSRHVIDFQREVAAWLAVSDDTLFDEILSCDPQVLLLADLAARSEADRGRVAAALLRQVREDYTVHLDSLLLYRSTTLGWPASLYLRSTRASPLMSYTLPCKSPVPAPRWH